MILDIRKREVESKSINQSSESLPMTRLSNAAQVLISLPNCRHVLIDRLIRNLFANIVNLLHYCTVYKV